MSKAATTILCLVIAVSAVCSVTAQSVDQLSNREKAIREEAVIALRIKLEQAESSRNEAKARDELLKTALLYEEAVNHLNKVGPIAAVEAERQRTVEGMAEIRLKLADKFQKAQKFYEADQEAVRILKLDPSNEGALQFKAANDKLILRYTGRQPSRDAITKIPAVREQQIQASTMIQDARLFLELNKLEEAEAKLNEAKKLDPESNAVWYYLSLLNQKKFQRETRKREITSQEKMIEVANYWDPGLNKNELPISNSYASTNLVHTGLGRQKIISKMDRIILDEVVFDGLPLSEVVQFLYDEARERDAEEEGINFVISNHMDTGVQASPFPGGMDPLTGLPSIAPLPTEPVDLYSVGITITPPLRNVKLSQVVELVTNVAETPIKFSILDYAVIFTKKTEETEPLFTRTYKVDPDVFIQGMEGVTG
ncbi:hypothetical protein OAH23_12605, partial [Verrucomicrobia bacterium]|nr:hypothetical protein [Verrucomicrobiota bacterium]